MVLEKHGQFLVMIRLSLKIVRGKDSSKCSELGRSLLNVHGRVSPAWD